MGRERGGGGGGGSGGEGWWGGCADRPISHYCEQQGLIDEGWCW